MKVDWYRNAPVLDFEDHDRYPTRLGLGKLSAVVDDIELALEFLSSHGQAEVVRRFRERFRAVETSSTKSERKEEIANEQG